MITMRCFRIRFTDIQWGHKVYISVSSSAAITDFPNHKGLGLGLGLNLCCLYCVAVAN
jgi:hypothetical protein